LPYHLLWAAVRADTSVRKLPREVVCQIMVWFHFFNVYHSCRMSMAMNFYNLSKSKKNLYLYRKKKVNWIIKQWMDMNDARYLIIHRAYTLRLFSINNLCTFPQFFEFFFNFNNVHCFKLYNYFNWIIELLLHSKLKFRFVLCAGWMFGSLKLRTWVWKGSKILHDEKSFLSEKNFHT
jgi:hypothetical protein